MLVSLTVGKVDAGMAVLLTEDKRIIEFPSILLPSDITSGSIVDISVARNTATEAANQKTFSSLQSSILNTFGSRLPATPVLRCRNATQTAVVLEWDPIDLATADLRLLSLYRNGSKAGAIPRPTELTSTKISGLAVDTEYTFQLVLRTSAGTFSSKKLTVRTHKMTDLTGITVTPGVMPGALRTSLAETVERMGAKLIDGVRIDTTHFVCTEPRGAAWERAKEMNIPIVVPDWVKGCESEGRIIGVRQYYLDADPRHRSIGASVVTSPQSQTRPSTPPPMPSTKITPPTPEQSTAPEVPPKDTPFRNSGQSDASIAEEDEVVADEKVSNEDSVPETVWKTRPQAVDYPEREVPTSMHPTRGKVVPAKDAEPSKDKRATVEDGEEEDVSFQDVML